MDVFRKLSCLISFVNEFYLVSDVHIGIFNPGDTNEGRKVVKTLSLPTASAIIRPKLLGREALFMIDKEVLVSDWN